MKIHNQELDIEDLVVQENPRSMLKTNHNGIYLSEQDIAVLNRYEFDYQKYSNVKSLLFDIEEYLNDNYDSDLEDLENVSKSLSEFDYYHNMNK